MGKLAIKPLASHESSFTHGDGGGMLEAFSERGWFSEYKRIILTVAVVAHPP